MTEPIVTDPIITECQVCHEVKACLDWDGWYICHDDYYYGWQVEVGAVEYRGDPSERPANTGLHTQER